MNKILAVALVFCALNLASAQVEIGEGEKPSILDRMYIGGGFSASFGTITSVYVSPVVGYMITRSLSGGVGVTYMYYKNDFFNFETSTYGGKLFLRQNIRLLRLPLFLYSEYENLNVETVEILPNNDYRLNREWVPSMFLGGGLFQPFGRRGGFYMMAMYNVIYDDLRSPYNSPWVFRVGFTL